MRTFVFDADGVVCVGGSFGVALEHDHHIPRERLSAFFDGPFRECMLGQRDLRKVITDLLPSWGWQGSVEDLLASWFRHEHVVCPEVLVCVQTLRARGHHCVLGTNQEKYRAAYLRNEMGFAAAFDGIFVSCELGAAKPTPEFFRQIEQRLPSTPEDICLVDDSAANVAGARAVGWHAVHYRGVPDIAAIFQQARL